MQKLTSLLVAVVTLPLCANASITKMTKINADSTSVGNAVLATLGTNVGSLVSCSTICSLNPSCLAFTYKSKSCIMVNMTKIASPISNTSMTQVYFSAPATTNWTTWTTWSGCSAQCDGGTQSRNRTLMCIYNNGQTLVCLNNTVQVDLPACNTFACVNSTWASWTQWTQCPVTCGGGTQTRSRTLTCNYYNGTTKACPNNTVQADSPKTCHNFTCACRTVGGGVPNAACVLPFKVYYSSTGQSFIYPACAKMGYVICGTAYYHDSNDPNTWGTCDPTCPRCLTVDGPTPDTDCIFPFTYSGISYNTCTTINNGANNGKAWCVTGSNAATQWGICDDARLCPSGN